ncbi:MAG: allophanate hydrolase subunit 1 [Candidatus Nanopelagicales bacterium]
MMPAVTRVAPCGDRALLADCADPAGVAAAVRGAALPGVVEVVPGAATVLVRHDASADRAALTRAVADLEPAPRSEDASPVVELDVVYDGPDLDEVAALTGLSRAEVVARHQASDFEVAFCGFSPGFAYLRGLDRALHVPRLATPRTAVPAGAVAIADVWSAVYPRESPGGWRLLGTTDATLWDVDRSPPALLAPGTRVRFRQAGP